MDTYDVAIVGYGPVGQLLSILMGQRGYRVAVLERWPTAYPLPRAVHLDHEIARVLQSVDLRSDRDPVIEPYDDWYEWRNAAGQTLLKVDWRGVGPSWWHTSNFFSQPELERELDLRVQKQASVTVMRGCTVTGVELDLNGVTVVATTALPEASGPHASAPQEQRVRARYVVGCDGANSVVRDLAGLTTTDVGFPFDWLILDMIPNKPMRFEPPAWQLCDPVRPTTIVPGGPGRRRWEFMALPGEDIQDLNRADRAWELLEPWGLTPDNAVLERHAVYRFQARWCDQWRQGRILIAGDAAHLMPPFAGQGMCSGLRDANNLAWKLDLVLRGQADDSVLDSYGPERTPHVRYFIELSMQLGRVICVPDAEAAARRDEDMIAAIEDPALAPPPADPPRLGAGVLAADDPAAGVLSIQSRVGFAGREGLFDDLVGYGWFLLTRVPPPALSGEAQATWARLGGRALTVGEGVDQDLVDLVDLDGRYAGWFRELGVEAVVVRPDFYVYAALPAVEALDDTLVALGRQVPPARLVTA